MTSEDIKTYQPHLGRESYDLAMCEWLKEIAFQLATQNERGAIDLNPQGDRTGPEYQIRDVRDGLNRIENIAAAARIRKVVDEYPAALERIREVVERIRLLMTNQELEAAERLTGLRRR